MLKQIQSIVKMLVALTSLLLISQAAVADSINGYVDFAARIQVDSAVEGTVLQVNAKVGERVKAGTVLIELDSTRQQARLQIATNEVAKMQIRVADAEAEFDRKQELYDRGSLSLLIFADVENELKLTRLDLSNAQAKLAKAKYEKSLTQLASPIDAVVVGNWAQVGMQVHPEDFARASLMTLASDGEYAVVIDVPSELWHQIMAKQTASVTVDGKNYIAEIEPGLDPLAYFSENPTYPIRLRFDDKERFILPSTAATVTLE